MTLKKWTEVLVETDKKKDMTYSFTFKNQNGQDVWGTKIRPLSGARIFLAGVGLKKNLDYDYTADKLTIESTFRSQCDRDKNISCTNKRTPKRVLKMFFF